MIRRLAGVALLGSTLAGCAPVNPYYDGSRAHHGPDGFVNNYGP